MNKSNHSTSDSESDEDYIIEGDNATLDSSDDADDSEDQEELINKLSKQSCANFKQKNERIANVSISAQRQTRQSIASDNIKRSLEREELQSDEEADKTRSDSLWADFLSDVDSKRITKTATNSDKGTSKTVIPVNSNAVELSCPPRVEGSDGFDTDPRVCSSKRPVECSSVSKVLSRFTKKKKTSVLEESKADWKDFKTDEGIDEDLRTHNKGKDGYLERQEFLQRTDLRQFEIEKKMRQSSRQN
ncbi:hypothetical protein KR032_006903 [Drosophila birchii]|nr:hypothetical protein KR032_006903 [Drosophila birchii]